MQISDATSNGQGSSSAEETHAGVFATAELTNKTWTGLVRVNSGADGSERCYPSDTFGLRNTFRVSTSDAYGNDDTDNSTDDTATSSNVPDTTGSGSSSAASPESADAATSILEPGLEAPDVDDIVQQVGFEFELLVPVEDVHVKTRPDRYFVSMQELASHVAQAPDYPAQIFVEDTLKEAGVPAVALCRKTATDRDGLYGVWVVTKEESIEPNSSSEGALSSAAKGETGLSDDCWLCGLEVNSRKLPTNADGFAETDRVLRTLRKHTLMHINEGCGLHVHVDAGGLKLEERKHFVCLYLMAETALFSFCAPHRQGAMGCLPVAQNSRMGVAARAECDRRRGVFRGGLSLELHNLVHRAANSSELRDSLLKPGLGASGPWARTALAMKHVGRRREEDKWTFEFRHSQASLDPVLVRHWARICVALVSAAKGLGDYGDITANEVYGTFYDLHQEQQHDDGWLVLLKMLRLDDSDTISFWRRKLPAYQCPNGWTQGEQGEDGFVTVLGS